VDDVLDHLLPADWREHDAEQTDQVMLQEQADRG
jgi:hypothetical protein